MRYLRLMFGLIITVLNGCSLINKSDELELSHHKLESTAIIVPKELSRNLISDRYPIPKSGSNKHWPTTKQLLLPPGSNI